MWLQCPFLYVHWAPGFRRFSQNLRKATISFVMSVCLSAWNNLAPTGYISIKFNMWVFFANLSGIFKFHYNRVRIKGPLHAGRYTFVIISRSVLLRMFHKKNCRENSKQKLIFNNAVFFENHAVYGIIWIHILDRGKPQMKIWRAL